MGCLGVHFALPEEEVDRLRDMEEAERVDYLYEVIEEEYLGNQPEWTAQSDKAWDAMHRALSDGELTWEGGDYPLNHVILGGELLYTESDHILVLKTPEQVRDVAIHLPGVSQEDFRQRYFEIDQESYGFPVDEDDLGYTWHWFEVVREFWMRASNSGRYVLFSASQ